MFRAKADRGGTVRTFAIRIRGIRARSVDIGAVRAEGEQGGDGLMVTVLVLMAVIFWGANDASWYYTYLTQANLLSSQF